jgi:hypothetical protein
VPCPHAARYADRHGERSVAPVIAISLSGLGLGLGRGLRPEQVLTVIGRVRAFGECVRSGEDADDPTARIPRIRSEVERLLTIPELDIPAGALDPYLDFLGAKIASEDSAAAWVRCTEGLQRRLDDRFQG